MVHALLDGITVELRFGRRLAGRRTRGRWTIRPPLLESQ